MPSLYPNSEIGALGSLPTPPHSIVGLIDTQNLDWEVLACEAIAADRR